jgi:hypothetical protein
MAKPVADSRGIPDFGLLHVDLKASRRDQLLYYPSTCSISTASICARGGARRTQGHDVRAPR